MPSIMLAEDDLTMVTLLKTLLGMEGYESARKNRPDVLLLDVHLHQVNGLDVLEQVRKDDEIGDLKVVMTSGLNLESECKNLGANDFLLKPYMPDDLLQILKRNISQS